MVDGRWPEIGMLAIFFLTIIAMPSTECWRQKLR
jgi:hypothetical protein